MEKFDVIVIGSGIGGLTTAALLSKIAKKKVLVLEQHWEFGGLTHEFNRKGKFTWDVGLHYIGNMDKNSLPMKIFDFISDGKLTWNKMPYEFEKFVYPDFTFNVPSSPDEYIKKLCNNYPKETRAIRKYFKDIKKASSWAGMKMVESLVPEPVSFLIGLWSKLGEGLALGTTKSYLDSQFKDEKLKSLLVSQWGDYGLPPSRSVFLIHSIIVEHYLNGGIFPEGGASSIAKSIRPVIESAGGKCMVNTEVTKLIVEDGILKGVEGVEKKGDRNSLVFEAPVVVSCTGALHSYGTLLKGHIPDSYMEDLIKIPAGKSAVTLYLGLKKSPESIGIKGENYWIYESYEHEEVANPHHALNGNPKFCYLSFPSLKNKSALNHTAEIISFSDFSSFEKWKDTKWKKRGEEYEKLKTKISDGLLEIVEKHIPGFKDLVEFQELSTPLTYVELSGRKNSEFYGIPASKERYKLKWLGHKTPLKNFYLSGSDVFSLGITGAMMGGVAAAASILDPAGFPKIMKVVNQK